MAKYTKLTESRPPPIAFDDEDRPPLSYYEKIKADEPKIHTPGGRTIMAKEWVKAPEFVPTSTSGAKAPSEWVKAAEFVPKQRATLQMQDGCIISMRHITSNQIDNRADKSKRHTIHVPDQMHPHDPPHVPSTRHQPAMCHVPVSAPPQAPFHAHQRAPMPNKPVPPPVVSNQPAFVHQPPAPNAMPPRMGPPPIWMPNISHAMMMPQPPPAMVQSTGPMHPNPLLTNMFSQNIMSINNSMYDSIYFGAGQTSMRQSQPGPSNPSTGGIYANVPHRGLNAHHVAAVRAGAMHMLPPGYSANVTTINAGINGQPIPAIVLKKRRKKKNRRSSKYTGIPEKQGSCQLSDTDSAATDRAPTDPASAVNNTVADPLNNRMPAHLTASEYLGSESTEHSLRRSEPDLTRPEIKVGMPQHGSFGSALNNRSLVTSSCPDLTDAQWEMVDEFWLPISTSDATDCKGVTSGMYPQTASHSVQHIPVRDEDYDVYHGAVFNAFQHSVTQKSTDLIALENQMLIERERSILDKINHGELRDVSVDGDVPSDEERLYQRLIDQTHLKRSMAGVRTGGARSLMQEMAETAGYTSGGGSVAEISHKAAVIDKNGQSRLYSPGTDEEYSSIRITGNPFSQEVDAVIGQPKSAMYNFGANRLFRSESESGLARLQPPAVDVCCSVM